MTVAAPVRTQRRAPPDVDVRRVVRGDMQALATFVARLPPTARRLRFLGAVTPAGAARGLVERSQGVLAIAREDGQIVGHACFVVDDDGRADIGVAVLDAWQRRGIGERLLRRLAAIAAERGVHILAARVSAANAGLVEKLAEAGVPLVVHGEGELLLRVEMPVSGFPAAAAAARADGVLPDRWSNDT